MHFPTLTTILLLLCTTSTLATSLVRRASCDDDGDAEPRCCATLLGGYFIGTVDELLDGAEYSAVGLDCISVARNKQACPGGYAGQSLCCEPLDPKVLQEGGAVIPGVSGGTIDGCFFPINANTATCSAGYKFQCCAVNVATPLLTTVLGLLGNTGTVLGSLCEAPVNGKCRNLDISQVPPLCCKTVTITDPSIQVLLEELDPTKTAFQVCEGPKV